MKGSSPAGLARPEISAVIRAVTLDVGGTLIEPWPSVGHVYGAVAQAFGCPSVDAGCLSAAFGQAWKLCRPFDYSRAAWRSVVDRAFALVDETADFQVSDACFSAIYDRFAQASAWRRFEDVDPLLDGVAAMGLKVALVSNWDERLRPLLDELGILSRVAAVVVSHEVGWAKPAPEIFARAVAALRVAPDEVLHIGDSELEDFHGARSAGLNACWLQRTGIAHGQAGQIPSLRAGLELLQRRQAPVKPE